jgi:hypothetical protein
MMEKALMSSWQNDSRSVNGKALGMAKGADGRFGARGHGREPRKSL